MDNSRLFVGKLPFAYDDQKLHDLFSAIEGVEVTNAKVITDRETGRSKGFGFVALADASMSDKAIKALHGTMIDEREIVVSVAREREERPAQAHGRDNRPTTSWNSQRS